MTVINYPTGIRDTVIPEDVMGAAVKVAETVLRNLDQDDVTYEVKAIARAIMAEREHSANIASDERWRTDAPPLDGTIIYRRVIQPYRYQPYKPNSQQAKRGEKGRWQMMNEYGGWENCPPPLGNEWSFDFPTR